MAATSAAASIHGRHPIGDVVIARQRLAAAAIPVEYEPVIVHGGGHAGLIGLGDTRRLAERALRIRLCAQEAAQTASALVPLGGIRIGQHLA